jgi:hypothetical protein
MKHSNNEGICTNDGERWPCLYMTLAINLFILWICSAVILIAVFGT